MKTIVGSFDTFSEAREVIDQLHRSGFAPDDISLIASTPDGAENADAAASEASSGAATGAAAGGLLGGAAGLVVGLMGLAIPGIGPIVAAGPLAATLAGAGVGAVAGGLIGGLTNAGVPEEEAKLYAEAVRRGGALVTVRAEDVRAEEAAALLRQAGAIDIDRRAEQWRGQGWQQRQEDELAPFSIEDRSHDRVAASAADGSGTAAGIGAMSGTRTASELSMHDSAALGTSSSDDGWNVEREHFRVGHEGAGGDWNEFEPAYRYGWGLGRDERYRGQDWQSVEMHARRDWESRESGGWERVKGAVRRGWERTTAALENATDGR
jgi:uncharacterized membrane protein